MMMPGSVVVDGGTVWLMEMTIVEMVVSSC